MLLQIIVALLIVASTAYLVSQGILSNLLLFVSVTFSSLLAMGLYEMVSPFLAGWRPDYANALSFFGIFVISSAILRVVTGVVIYDNIPLDKWIDRSGAGVIGFFTSLVAIGTLVIAMDMLPIYDDYLGFERFPAGVNAAASGLWIPADSLVTGLYKLASNGSMGGNSFSAIHPDLSRELYGQRHGYYFTARLTVPADLVKVPAAFIYTDPAQIKSTFGDLHADSTHILVARTVIDHGTKDKNSADAGNPEYFRAVPSEVRLLTSKQNSLYPIGYMHRGTSFTPLDPVKGYVIHDYHETNNNVIIDWVFALSDDEDPRLLEMKEFARVDLQGALGTSKANTYKPLAMTDYSPDGWLKDQAAVQVELKVTTPSGKMADTSGVKVWVVPASTPAINPLNTTDNLLGNLIKDAFDQHLDEHTQPRFAGLRNENPNTAVSLEMTLQMLTLMTTVNTGKPEADARTFETYFNEKVVPMLDARANFTLITDKSGATIPQSTVPLSNRLVVTLLVVKKPVYTVYLFRKGIDIEPKKTTVLKFTEKNDVKVFGLP